MATTITGVRVFDGERLREETAVRVDGETIDALGGNDLLRTGDEHVDGGGGTLLPGLIDAHVHLLAGAPRQAIPFGVTTLLDMFSKPDQVRAALAEAAGRDAADVRSSSVGATAPGGHPSMMYAPFPYATGPDEAEAFVAGRVAEGATHLKILYEEGAALGPLAMPSLDLPTVRALVTAGHRAGLVVVAHATTARAATDMVASGVNVLAHVPMDPLTGTQAEAFAEAGVSVVATLAVGEGYPADPGTVPLLERPALAGRLGPAWAEVLRAQSRRWMPPGMPDFSVAADNVRRLHAAGVRILAGTDAPNPGTVHGAGLHRELELLSGAGLGPEGALAAATARTADAFGLDDRGRIRPGLRADLLLTGGRPDERVTDGQEIRGVWRGGVRARLDGYVGSAAERAGIAELRAQTDKIIAAVRELLPGIEPPEPG